MLQPVRIAPTLYDSHFSLSPPFPVFFICVWQEESRALAHMSEPVVTLQTPLASLDFASEDVSLGLTVYCLPFTVVYRLLFAVYRWRASIFGLRECEFTV